MSRESVQAFFEVNAPDIEPVVLTDSTATVAEAAQALGVEEGQIAKTLALKVGDERILVVMAGTGRDGWITARRRIRSATGLACCLRTRYWN
ncbi:YbaK/prolyl-tRNA synthetase associated region [Acetobacter senegalensis]|uniref:YbaK/prolyl-tRNA synthetase associated region n=1 Tax=Acetobacter senegalensis TaxID=446692 RepID=A0A0U5BCY5_9PROT|nr:YbaK/prolyl-tRNA synthetase associated region [Acetobacter senegalensis]